MPTDSWMKWFTISYYMKSNNGFSCYLRPIFFVRAFINLPHNNPTIYAHAATTRFKHNLTIKPEEKYNAKTWTQTGSSETDTNILSAEYHDITAKTAKSYVFSRRDNCTTSWEHLIAPRSWHIHLVHSDHFLNLIKIKPGAMWLCGYYNPQPSIIVVGT